MKYVIHFSLLVLVLMKKYSTTARVGVLLNCTRVHFSVLVPDYDVTRVYFSYLIPMKKYSITTTAYSYLRVHLFIHALMKKYSHTSEVNICLFLPVYISA